MRIFIIIIMLLTLTLYSAFPQTRRALVVGIGDYPASGGWCRISGDRDVELVRNTLHINGFDDRNITTLINGQATFDNIRGEFVRLSEIARPGDVVYVHFSAHGQQVTDLDGDEADGFDEAIVPYDAPKEYRKGVYEGQCHITDDLLNVWLSKIRDKIGEGGKIVVISDACHSGDGSRYEYDDEDGPVMRGTSDKFVIPNVLQSKSAVEKPIRWTYISACKSYQSNYEIVDAVSGQRFGRLTYHIYEFEKSERLLSRISAEDFGAMLRKAFGASCDIPQTPTIESENKAATLL